MALIETQGLGYRWPGGRDALRDVSLTIEQGTHTAVLGANGAGKSTLLKLLCGLLKPTSGSATVCGFALKPNNLPAIRQRLGLVFQTPDDQLFCPTVREDVAFGPRNLGLTGEALAERVNTSMAQTAVTELGDRMAHQLSPGEKKRVALAGVLAMQPDVIALDEPSNMLDPRGRRELAELLESLDSTLVVVTHDLTLARRLCPHWVVLCDGAQVFDAPAGELTFDDPRLADWGLA